MGSDLTTPTKTMLTSLFKKPVRKWGNWKLQKDGSLQLQTNTSRWIDLRRCVDSAEILDWIFHYQGRLSAQDLADMVQALEDVLEPRTNYCGNGQGKRHRPVDLVRDYWKRSE